MTSVPRISKVTSGGQTGVDRAGLDWAIASGIPYGGWCPKSGWAEDFPNPPGLLAVYPELRESPSTDPQQRTDWNVRDSDATVVFMAPEADSPGTRFTLERTRAQQKPVLVVNPQQPQALVELVGFVTKVGDSLVLNIAGPRESESPGIYKAVLDRLNQLRSS